jgi:hypothetical protein
LTGGIALPGPSSRHSAGTALPAAIEAAPRT